MTDLKPQPGILDVNLYVGGKSEVEGVKDILKLSSNENPSGPPQSAQLALAAAAPHLHRYPDGGQTELRETIARQFDLDAGRIICGCGSDELIGLVCQAFSGPGVEVIHSSHAFLMYNIYARVAGATIVEVAEKDRYVDVDAMLAGITDKTGVIFVANPGNPTGTYIPDTDIKRLIDGTPSNVMIVLDGAYADFVTGWDGGAALVEAHENVVMLRTLSKMYGLGGLRVGWGYASQFVIDVMNRVRGPFNLSAPAQVAGVAAIQDHAFADATRAENYDARTWLASELAGLGIPSDPSETNFILARFKDQTQAEACDDYLQTQGIIVRRVGSYGLPECLRITIPDMAGCERVMVAIRAFMETQS